MARTPAPDEHIFCTVAKMYYECPRRCGLFSAHIHAIFVPGMEPVPRNAEIMSNALGAASTSLIPALADLPADPPVPIEQSPAAIYLASLDRSSRRTHGALLSVGETMNHARQDVCCLLVSWVGLRYTFPEQHFPPSRPGEEHYARHQ